MVGAGVGFEVGRLVGSSEGRLLGFEEGSSEGRLLGAEDGWADLDGCIDGDDEGSIDGSNSLHPSSPGLK